MFCNFFLDFGVAEECCDEFTGTIGFITAGETTRDEDRLRLFHFFCKAFDGISNTCSRQVVDDKDVRFCASSFHSLCRVKFAVCAGEYRDQYTRFRNRSFCLVCDAFCVCCECGDFHFFFCSNAVHRIDFFQFIFISCKNFCQSDAVCAVNDGIAACCTQNSANCYVFCQFQNEGTVVITKDIFFAYAVSICKADIVTHCHFQNSFRHAAQSRCVSSCNLAVSHQTCYHIEQFLQAVCCRQTFCIIFGFHQNDFMACSLEFGRNDVFDAVYCDCEGYQCRRYIDIFKGTTHGVLTADGSDFQTFLCHECAQQSRQRFAPAFCVFTQFFEVFLEGQINFFEICTSRNQFCNGFYDCQICTVVRALFCDKRIVAPCHQGACCGIFLFYGYFIYHRLNGCFLVFAAERHQNCTGTNGGVETFGQTSLGADIQILCQFHVTYFEISGDFFCEFFRCCRSNINMFFRTVGIQECTGQVYNLFAVPCHFQRRFFCYSGNNCCFQIFLECQFFKSFYVFCSNHNCHSFLRFGNRQFCAVQTVIFFRYCVQINFQTICQFTDSNGNTACTKVVTTFDQLRCFCVSEQSLQFSFFWSVTLLYFCAAAFQRFYCMGFGGACRTTAAVTACFAAQEDYDIAVFGAFSAYVFCRSRCDNCTDFHSLCHIAGMIEFIYLTCCQTDLVTIGAITSSRCSNDRSLRQFTFDRFGYGFQRVSCTCHTHSSVNIGTTAQRVTDGTANASSRAAERFDFCRMVVCFIFEQQQPFLCFAFHINVDFYSTSIDFFGFIQTIQFAFFFQQFCSDSANIHQVDGFCSADGFSGCQVFIVSILQQFVFKLDAVDGCIECCMTAMIGPVCIDHFDFCDGRISVFTQEVVLAYFDIIQIHRQAHIFHHSIQTCFIQFDEAFQCCYFCGDFILNIQCIKCIQCCFSGFYRVDQEFFDFCYVSICQIAIQNVYFCRSDQRSVLFGDDLDTFCCGGCSLVELTGQEFHCECHCAICGQFFSQVIQLGFREYCFCTVVEQILIQTFCIVSVQKTQTCQTFDTQQIHDFASQSICFCSQTCFFLYINSINHTLYTSASRAFLPISFL